MRKYFSILEKNTNFDKKNVLLRNFNGVSNRPSYCHMQDDKQCIKLTCPGRGGEGGSPFPLNVKKITQIYENVKQICPHSVKANPLMTS